MVASGWVAWAFVLVVIAVLEARRYGRHSVVPDADLVPAAGTTPAGADPPDTGSDELGDMVAALDAANTRVTELELVVADLEQQIAATEPTREELTAARQVIAHLQTRLAETADQARGHELEAARLSGELAALRPALDGRTPAPVDAPLPPFDVLSAIAETRRRTDAQET